MPKLKAQAGKSSKNLNRRPRPIIPKIAAAVFVVVFVALGTYVVHQGLADTAAVDASQVPESTGVTAVAAAKSECPEFAFTPVYSSFGGEYWLNPDRYGGGTMCPSTDGGTDFTVVSGGTAQPNTGKVQAYPDIIGGCSNTACVHGSNLPRKVSAFSGANPRVSVSLAGLSAGGEWDNAYDIWFNKYDTVGPSAGTEILIMLNEKNLPFPNLGKFKEYVSGAWWWMMWTDVTSGGRTWRFVEFRRVNTTTYTSQTPLVPFFQKAESVGMLSSSWYLTGVDSGFEIWGGGLGLSEADYVVGGL